MKQLLHTVLPLVVVFLALAGAASCQTDTRLVSVIQTVAINSANVTDTLVVRQIGQNLHILNAAYSNAPGQNCLLSPDTGALQIFGSFNGSAYIQIARGLTYLATTDPAGAQAFSVQALGAYPYIQAVAVNFDVVRCRQSVWYSGSQAGNLSIPVQNSAAQDSLLNYTASTAGNVTLFLGVPEKRIVVYELMLMCVQPALPNVCNASLDNGAGTETFLVLTGMIPGNTVLYPNTGRPHFIVPPGFNLRLLMGGGSNLNYHLRMQWEK